MADLPNPWLMNPVVGIPTSGPAAAPAPSPPAAAADLIHSSDCGVEGHALSQTSPTTQHLKGSRGPRGIHRADIKPGQSDPLSELITWLDDHRFILDVPRFILEIDEPPLFLRRARG